MATTLGDLEGIIGRVGLGDRAAFSALYDATSAKLFGVCLSVLKNRAEAEEALQDVYLRIWQKAGRYTAQGYSPMTWLITIARNRAIDQLRARRTGMSIDAIPEPPDAAPTPEATAIAQSEMEHIRRCLDELEKLRAAAVRGAYLDGDSYKELATRFDVPLNTMRTWLRRSLLQLRECLSR